MAQGQRGDGSPATIFAPGTGDGAGKPEYAVAGQGGASTGPQPAAERPAPDATAAAQARSRVLAQAVVTSMVDRLTSEAQRRGGSLSVADLQGLNAEFESKTAALEAVFEKSFEEYARALSQPRPPEVRTAPFLRLLVRNLEPLLNDPDGGLSRRILPGLFLATTMMLGNDLVDAYERTCEAIVERLRVARGAAFGWNDYYIDPEANAVGLDALAGMALHFEDPRRRGQWLMGVVNAHLAPPAAGEAEGDGQLEPRTIPVVLNALFGDLAGAMVSDAGRERIAASHGPDAGKKIQQILGRIEKLSA